jgi:hypothetical protein
MRRKCIIYISLSLIFAFATASIVSVFNVPEAPIAAKKFLTKIPGLFPAAVNFQPEFEPLPHYGILDKNGKVISLLFSSDDLGIIRHGYKNKVEVFVCFSSNGVIQHVELGAHIETPRLVEKMRRSKFFRNWRGQTGESSAPPYVTGATYTSEAVSNAIKDMVAKLNENKFFDKRSTLVRKLI